MKTFFDSLRRAREEKGITLESISNTTLINIKYLEAIEKGNTSILPATYIRAFIREYAAAVGLDSAETMRRFDTAEVPGARPPHAIPPSLSSTAGGSGEGSWNLVLTQRNATIAGIAVVVIAAAILFRNLAAPEATPPVKETPFQSIVKEQEKKITSAMPAPAPRTPRTIDSLTLSAFVTDSVWITIAVDSLPSREYLFRPGAKAVWRAGEKFTLTMGNAGGIVFMLNKKSLGALGRRGSVLRDVHLTRQTIAGR